MIRFNRSRRPVLLAFLAAIVLLGTTAPAAAQDERSASVAPTGAGLPNPTSDVIRGWGPLPDGREWGSTAGVDIDPTDGHVWAYDRCGGIMLAGGCAENLVDPVVKFDRNTGEVLTSFGAGLFVLPHGIHVDADGNVWITDSQGTEDKGHRVIKFSPEGEVLLILGQAGRAGSGPGLLNEPCDVITAPNGDIFVSDGHSGQNGRIPETPADACSSRTAVTIESRSSIRTATTWTRTTSSDESAVCLSTARTTCTRSTRSRRRGTTRVGRPACGSGMPEKTG
jgi:DNA-binding beta-propeller fold protein YncE